MNNTNHETTDRKLDDHYETLLTNESVAELAIVPDTFHTKPLRRFLQSSGRYQVLGLSLEKIQLFEGDRDVLDEIDPAPGVPRTFTEAGPSTDRTASTDVERHHNHNRRTQ